MKYSISIAMLACFALTTLRARAAEETPPAKESPPAATATVPTPTSTAAPAAPSKDRNDISEILNSMGYPELQVVPRASERLAIEARYEDSNAWIFHWPMELAGFTTFVVAYEGENNLQSSPTTKQSNDARMISDIGMVVGASWMLGGAVLGLQRPYHKAARAISKYPGKDERSALLRERLAEEALERTAENMRILDDVSVYTNVTVDIASAWHANQTGQAIAAVGAITAFLPWIFQDHSITVYDKQIEYKKKIYVPLAAASFHYEPLSKTYTPESMLTWKF